MKGAGKMENKTIIELSKVITQLQNEIDYLSEELYQERKKNADKKAGGNREIEPKKEAF